MIHWGSSDPVGPYRVSTGFRQNPVLARGDPTCFDGLLDYPVLVHDLCGRFSLMSGVYCNLRHRWLQGLTRKALSAAVAASEGQCLGSCPRSAKISMSSQDDLGQGPACSALVMDPEQMEVRGLRPLASNG